MSVMSDAMMSVVLGVLIAVIKLAIEKLKSRPDAEDSAPVMQSVATLQFLVTAAMELDIARIQREKKAKGEE